MERERIRSPIIPFSRKKSENYSIPWNILLYRGNSKISIRVLANYYRIVVQFNRATSRLMIKIDG